MDATPIEVPADYKMGNAERAFIAKFEVLRRQNIPMTPSDFFERMRKPRSTFGRYKVLKHLLNEYGWQTKPDRMRGETPTLLQKVDLSPDPRITRMENKIERLKETVSQLAGLKQDIEVRDKEIEALRTALMATISHFSSASMSHAVGIERKLHKLYGELLPPHVVRSFLGGVDGDVSSSQ